MNHYHFIACGKQYMRMIDAYDSFKEVKELVIPIKYERENDFVDISFIQDSTFVTASTQNNFFVVDRGVVKYYINIQFNIKN